MKIDVAKRLRIAVLIRHYDRSGGGAERYCVELTERLAEIHEVHVFAQQVSTQSPNITFHTIPLRLKRPRFLNQLLFSRDTRRVTEGQYDLVHSHDMVTHADIYTLHVPCIKTKWSEASAWKKLGMALGILMSPRKMAYLWLEWRELRPLDNRRFITVSEYLTRNILKSYPKLDDLISVAHPGINIRPLPTEKKLQLRKNFREQHHIPESAFVLLFVAHGFKRKGLPTLIKALEQLNNEKLHLLVAGRGDPATISFEEPGVKSRTHFLGTVKNMEQLYPVADTLVHPTLGDTYGMAVLEAMSQGLSIIVSNADYCGISEHLNSDNALLLTDPKNTKEIKHNINTLTNNTTHSTLSNHAQETAKTKDWKNTSENTQKTYNKINTINPSQQITYNRFEKLISRIKNRKIRRTIAHKYYKSVLPRNKYHIIDTLPEMRLYKKNGVFDVYFFDHLLGHAHLPTTSKNHINANLIGSGPSIKNQDLSYLSNSTVYLMNGSISLCNKYTFKNIFYVIIDSTFIANRFDIIEKSIPTNTKIFTTPGGLHCLLEHDKDFAKKHTITIIEDCSSKHLEEKKTIQQIQREDKENRFIFSKDSAFSTDIRHGYFNGGTVMYTAAQLAIYMGARNINIFGFDIGNSNQPRFNESKNDSLKSGLLKDYNNFILPSMKLLSSICKKNKITLKNMSPISIIPEDIIKKYNHHPSTTR